MARAAVACGADGVIMEVHPCPDCALCDGDQSITPELYYNLVKELRAVAQVVGRDI
jgi:3-deoxy-7-phosphoheptulonate synthase